MNLTEKYISGVILPLETSAYQDLPATVTFLPNSTDLVCTAVFESIGTANIVSGTALAVVNGGTVTVLTATESSKISGIMYGFQMSGDGDGVFQVYYNGTMIMRFTTSIIVPNITYSFPSPIMLNYNDVIQIQVYNACGVTANYTAVIIGIF